MYDNLFLTDLGAGDHNPITEAQVEHSLTVVDQGVHHLP